MKTLTKDIDFLAYNKVLRYLKANQCPLIIWQGHPEGRTIVHCVLNSFHDESKLMHLDKIADAKFYEGLPIFCYVEQFQMIFKSELFDFAEKYFSIYMPKELKVIEEREARKVVIPGMDFSTLWKSKRLKVEEIDETQDYYRVKSMSQRSNRDQELLGLEFGVSLDEEDRLFADKRESPRARPQGNKKVKIQKLDGEMVHKLKLFDLSRGGLAFLSDLNGMFSKSEKLMVTGFDEFDLDDPIFGVVMSVRPVDEAQDEWKIGIKFEDGQD